MPSSKTKTPKKAADLPPKEAALYQKGVRRITIFDRVSVVIVALLTFLLAFQLPSTADDGDGQISRVILLVGVLIIIQATLMIRLSVARLNTERQEERLVEDDHPLKGWLLTFFTPVIALLIFMPWISMGVFNDDDFGPVAASFLLLLLLAMALLLSVLVAAFILAPLELLVRGLVAVVKGDKKRVGYLYSGLFFSVITAFIIVMGLAVDTYHPFPASIPAQVASMLGVPGDYRVKNEVLLWIGRALAAVVTFFIVMIVTARPKAK